MMDSITDRIGELSTGSASDSTGMQTEGTAQCWRRTLTSKILHVQNNKNEKLPLQEQEEQLLPGIPDEVTLNQIATKLPWKVFHILSAVSRGWQQTIQSRCIYDSRVRASSTETFLVHDHLTTWNTNRIALYSLQDKRCYELPPIPGCSHGIPSGCHCIFLNGKVYVLGGEFNVLIPEYPREVNVLDVAGQRQWEQCASMQLERISFACGVKGGKIYIFGGVEGLRPVDRAEVYDPEVDAWSWIMPMASKRKFYHHVVALGNKFFLHGRYRFLSTEDNWKNPVSDVYDPIEDRWSDLGPSNMGGEGCLFEAQGKPHWMNHHDMYVFDTDDSSWKYLHSNSFPTSAVGPKGPVTFTFRPCYTFAVGAELFLRATWYIDGSKIRGLCLLRSEGFGATNREISWRVVSECHGHVVPQHFSRRFPKFQCIGALEL